MAKGSVSDYIGGNVAATVTEASMLRAVSVLLFAAAACTTGSGGNEPDSGVKATSTPRPAGTFELGPIEDEDLKQTIYKGMDARLGKTLAVGQDAEETTEIGDYESFRFAIVKLTRGNDDVSGEPGAAADGMDVEVSGWYKRTVDGDGETRAGCTSFDARLTVLKREGRWTVSDEHPMTFGREDPEDCY